MPLNANSLGVVEGSFTIPKGIKAGTKQVQFFGDPSNAKQQSNAETTFTGQGTVVTNTMRKVNNVMSSYYDPLAQTFMLRDPYHLSGVRLWVEVKGTTPLIVQLRETTVGFPTRTIVAEGQLDVSDPTYIQGGWVTVHFAEPFYASANIEYAVVVLANDADTAVGISELGKLDPSTNSYVTSQPYQVGVLLSSANASTWTAHQDKDLTFELLARRYTGTTKSQVLGVVKLPAGTTDILVSALTETPATGADADLKLEFLDVYGNVDPDSERHVSDGQVVKLPSALGGDTDMLVTANLRCTTTASATISPGTQIIAGALATSGEYVTRGIAVAAAGTAAGTTQKLIVTMETYDLPGAEWHVYYGEDKSASTGSAIAASAWTEISNSAPVGLSNGRSELVFTEPKFALSGTIKLKIKLVGTAAARTQIFNLRASFA